MAKLLYICLLLTCLGTSYAEPWFEESTPLSQAHQKLLDNKLEESFAAIVQVWQSNSDKYVASHLNQLLLKSLESDCGKSLSKEPLAPWIESITVRRQSLQSPGRRTSKLIVEATTSIDLDSLTVNRWPENEIATEVVFETIASSNKKMYQTRYDLGQRLPSGLYRLEVKAKSGQHWGTWVVMGESSVKQVVRWDSKDTWVVDKFGLLNPYCSLPVLSVSLYDYIENEYVRVWNREYESDYPRTIPLDKLTPNRYVLAVSITHQRWQGAISIEDQQVISKTYDITED